MNDAPGSEEDLIRREKQEGHYTAMIRYHEDQIERLLLIQTMAEQLQVGDLPVMDSEDASEPPC